MTLVLIDFQREFFDANGILGSNHVNISIANTAVRLIDAWPAHSHIVCITSCYDRWRSEVPTPQFVNCVRGESVTTNKSTRLAGAHSGKPCCERGSPLFVLVDVVETALLRRESTFPGTIHRIEKQYYSAFIETSLERVLRVNIVADSLVFAGQTTSTCVQATAIDAFRLGFNVTLCTDAASATSLAKHCVNVAATEVLRVWRPATSGELIRQAVPNPISAIDGFRSVPNILPAELAQLAFERVRAELPWAQMFHKGIAVSRLVATQCDVSIDGSVPIYRFPTDEQFRPSPWSSTMREIRDALQDVLAQQLNHAKAQLYEHRSAHIGPHSDKTLDIAHDSWIVNLSLGATRVMRVQSKQDPNIVEYIEMPHNSAVLFNTHANQRWLHSVPPCPKSAAQCNADDLLHNGARISIVFRAIATQLSADDRLSGQGAKPGFQAVDGTRHSTNALLAAFRDQNRQGGEFGWSATYGEGSNVVRLDPTVLHD